MTDPADDAGARPDNDTLLAFDFGLRRIGVAIGNLRLGTASALTTLIARDKAADLEAIGEILREWRPARLIPRVNHL